MFSLKNKNDAATQLSSVSQRNQLLNSKESKDIGYKRLVLMWGMILIGYFLFVVQWYCISNFSSGYSSAVGSITSPALNSMPNWTITLMRGIGSILAGWVLAKFGHKYAVIIVLSIMLISFPYLIVIGVNNGGGLGGMITDENGQYSPATFGLFLVFRLFLAVGGTTLITYTNSVIAKMPVQSRPKYMTINQWGFNGGAFVANFLFCFGLGTVLNQWPTWIIILTILLVLIAVILVVYVLFGKEILAPASKQSQAMQAQASFKDEVTFLGVFKQSYTWKMSTIFIVWLIAVVFINSATMRTVIENSPANFQALVEWNLANGRDGTTLPVVTSMAAATLSTANSVIVGSGYNWVWPTFICLFVAGFFVGQMVISPFSKTIFKRKFFISLMFILGFVFAAISIMCGYFGGYGNGAALAFYLIFIFISGFFLWSVQPVLLSLYQQAPQSNPKYAGIISGLIWGIGYVGYTVCELSLSLIATYGGPGYSDGTTFAAQVTQAMGTVAANGAMPTLPTYGGYVAVLVLFFVICALIFIPISMLPAAGIKDKDGNFKPFTEKWNVWNWNFRNKDYLIQ